MLIRKNLEFSSHLFVRPFVRKYLEIRSLVFSVTLQLVRTQKGGQNVPSAFLKNPVSPMLAKIVPKIDLFVPKCPKMEVFHIFLLNNLNTLNTFFVIPHHTSDGCTPPLARAISK